MLVDDAQRAFDLGLPPRATKAVLVSAPADALIPEQTPQARWWVRRPHVLKTNAGVLYEALAGVYTDPGFDAVGDEVFRDLVIARVVEPTSLLDVDRDLAELGRVAASHLTPPCGTTSDPTRDGPGRQGLLLPRDPHPPTHARDRFLHPRARRPEGPPAQARTTRWTSCGIRPGGLQGS